MWFSFDPGAAECDRWFHCSSEDWPSVSLLKRNDVCLRRSKMRDI